VLANIGAETDAFGASRIPVYAAQAAYSSPHRRTGPRCWTVGSPVYGAC